MIERDKMEPEEFRRVGSIAQKIMLDFLIKLKRSRTDFIQAAKKVEKVLKKQAETIKKSPCGDTGK
jgi:hypothetical protein